MTNDGMRARRTRAWALAIGALAIAIYAGFILLNLVD